MSFTFTNGRCTARVAGQHAYIPAVGWVRMRMQFTGDILSATVSLRAGCLFVSFQGWGLECVGELAASVNRAFLNSIANTSSTAYRSIP